MTKCDQAIREQKSPTITCEVSLGFDTNTLATHNLQDPSGAELPRGGPNATLNQNAFQIQMPEYHPQIVNSGAGQHCSNRSGKLGFRVSVVITGRLIPFVFQLHECERGLPSPVA